MDLCSNNNVMEICRDLWSMQKKLKEQLSRYGNYLETIRINPHNTEASNNMATLLNEIVDVGKKQNDLMEKCTDSISKVLEKYCSEKSLLLDNFRDSLIHQIWNNGVEQCIGDIGDDIFKILFLNQMDLIPTNLSKSLSVCDENFLTNTIDIANIRMKTALDGMYSLSNGNTSLRPVINNDINTDAILEPEPRCTRSSKVPLKRTINDIDHLKRSKSRKRVPQTILKPNSCCTICSKLIFANMDQGEAYTSFKDNSKILICCEQCVDKHYSSSGPGSILISNSNEDDSGSPSDSSSQNNN